MAPGFAAQVSPESPPGRPASSFSLGPTASLGCHPRAWQEQLRAGNGSWHLGPPSIRGPSPPALPPRGKARDRLVLECPSPQRSRKRPHGPAMVNSEKSVFQKSGVGILILDNQQL